jgi:4-amino-4-deoxy-L-arabinose transferase-like glycosyltransferase
MLDDIDFKKNIMELPKRDFWLDILIILVIAAVFLLYKLGSYPLFVPDEGRYPEVAREMLATGHWLSPTILNTPFLDKPILYYWVEAFSMHLFGVNIWAIRLPGVIFGMFGCVISYVIAGSCFSRSAGLFAAAFLLLGPLYFGAAHYANMDLQFAIWFSASMGSFILGLKWRYFRHKRNICMILMYVFAALAFLTKGLMGFVFPVLIIGLWVVLFKRWVLLKYMHVPIGLCVFFVIVLPWVFASQHINPHFFYYFFYFQQVGRYVGQSYNNPMPFWFYLPICIIGMLPWTTLSFAAWPRIRLIWGYMGSCLEKQYVNEYECFKPEGVVAFLVLWILVLFVFFSIPTSKIVGYILPIMVPMAVLFGVYFTGYVKRIGFYVFSWLNVLLFVILGFVLWDIENFIGGHAASKIIDFTFFAHVMDFVGAIFVLAALVNAVLLVIHKRMVTIWVCMVMIAIFDLSLVYVAPAFNRHTVLPMLNTVKDDITPNTVVVNLGKYNQDLPIYLNRNIYVVYSWDSIDLDTQDNWASDFLRGDLMAETPSPYLLEPANFVKMWANFSDNKKVVVFASKGAYKKWRNLLEPRPHLLAESDTEVVFSNE